MNKYEVLGVIGEGAYGVVLRCKNKESNEMVAIKKFKECEEDESVRKTTLREVKILRMLKHQNIVSLKEAFRRKGKLYLVFEHMDRNLLEVLEEHSSGLEPDIVRSYIYQLVKAIDFCHQHNVMHRDVKPENLLVNTSHVLKLCDFGFARMATKHGDDYTDYVATRWYRAPELLLASTAYDKSVDIWAIGCIMAELLDGQALFPGESEIDQLYIIQKVLGPLTQAQNELFLKNSRFFGFKFPDMTKPETLEKKLGAKFSKKALSFLKSVLQLDPSHRLTGQQCLHHPYFEGMHEGESTGAALKVSRSEIPQKEPFQAPDSHRSAPRSRQTMGARKLSTDNLSTFSTNIMPPESSLGIEKRNGRKSAKKPIANYDTDDASVSSKDVIPPRPHSRETTRFESTDVTASVDYALKERRGRELQDGDGYDSQDGKDYDRGTRFREAGPHLDRVASRAALKEPTFDVLPLLPSRGAVVESNADEVSVDELGKLRIRERDAQRIPSIPDPKSAGRQRTKKSGLAPTFATNTSSPSVYRATSPPHSEQYIPEGVSLRNRKAAKNDDEYGRIDHGHRLVSDVGLKELSLNDHHEQKEPRPPPFGVPQSSNPPNFVKKRKGKYEPAELGAAKPPVNDSHHHANHTTGEQQLPKLYNVSFFDVDSADFRPLSRNESPPDIRSEVGDSQQNFTSVYRRSGAIW